MSAVVAEQFYTPEEYLELERQAETRSEYFGGRLYAMSGSSWEHNIISGNVLLVLQQLEGHGFRAFANNLRVKVQVSGLYTYPDVGVVCGKPEFEDAHVDTLLNPAVLIEVLSPSTEAYDRGKKFEFYRGLASLREYLLIAQDRIFVEHYLRQDDAWVLQDFRRLEDVVRLPSIGCEVTLARIYQDIEFPQEESA